MHRKTALIVAAIVLPGGLIALLGTWLIRRLARTERVRKVVELARSRVPAWAAGLRVPVFRQRSAA